LREPSRPIYSRGGRFTENLDYFLEAVDCPRCGRRGGLWAHFGRYIQQVFWYGPYFGVLHVPGGVGERFCYFGRSYPSTIHTRVPDPNVEKPAV